MAGANNYKLLIEGKLDASKVEAQIKALSSKNIMLIKAQFDKSDMSKFQEELKKISDVATNKIGKISLFGNDAGGINKAIVEYTDALGNSVQQNILINKEVQSTQRYTQNIAKDEAAIVRLQEQQVKLTAKQADEMARSALNAEKFLAKSANMDQNNPQVKGAINTANQIKVAVDEGDIAKVRKLNDELAIQKAALVGVKSGLDSWTSGIKNAIKQTVEYSLSIGLVYGALNQLRQIFQYIIDLNKEMTNIQVLQVEGAQTNEEIAQLALNFNDLAKAMGATTIEVAQGSTEWLRQGKTIAETQELLKSTLMLAKLGNLETAEATDYLTSTLNSYKLEAEDASGVVDKLIAVDNKAATSAGELATALKYSSSTAQQAGVSLEELISYIGVVSSTTRQSAETIGQSFKTIFTRMQDIKAGKIDEDGLGLNNVESALERINVPLRDTQGEFRDMSDVLKDVSDKWSNLSEVEQANISKAIAGVRQANIFTVLMTHMNEAMALQEEQAKSTGLAMDRYGIYLQSVEAAQNKMTASWERLATSGATSQMIAGFYNALSVVLDLVTALGGLKTITILAITALGVYATTLDYTTVAMWNLNVAMDANPIGVFIGLVGLLVAGLSILIDNIDTTAEAIEKLTDEYNDLNEQFNKTKANADKMAELSARFEELRANTNRTNEEQEEFLRVQEEIKKILPEVAGHYDEMGNFILASSVSADTLTSSLNNLEKEQLKLLQAKALERINKESEAFANQSTQVMLLSTAIDLGLIEPLQEVFRWITNITGVLPGIGAAFREIANATGIFDLDPEKLLESLKGQTEDSANRIREDFYTLTDEATQKIFLNELRSTGAWGEKLAEELENSLSEVVPVAEQIGQETGEALVKEISEESKKAMEDLIDTTIDMIKDKKKAEEDALKDQLKDLKDLNDSQKDYYKSQLEDIKTINDEKKRNADREYEDQKRNIEQQKRAIEEQLNAVKQAIDAQRELLKLQKEEADYNEEKEDREQSLANLESQILTLSLDDSQEAIAERQRLEAEAAKLREEIAQAEADRAYQLQNDALDAEQEAAEQSANIQLTELERAQEQYDFEKELLERQLEYEEYAAERRYELVVQGLDAEYDAQEKALNDQIDQIENYLDQEGTMRRDAMDMIANDSANLYQQLLDWNLKYGTGINDDIVNMWNLATQAVEGYSQALGQLGTGGGSVGSTSPIGGVGSNVGPVGGIGGVGSRIGSNHDGVDSGFIGKKATLKSNEEFRKLMKGELVLKAQDMDNFMKNILPRQMLPEMSSANSGGISIEKLLEINVNGGVLDKTVVPEISDLVNRAVEKLNATMQSRGYNRRADLFQI